MGQLRILTGIADQIRYDDLNAGFVRVGDVTVVGDHDSEAAILQ
ncbi:hypothetical protein L541_0635 [Bordetella hinzii CA90 BAL1384]|nr:hypothetical protein L541_0635 [Bordetella hinzii CA90 BAL1384]